MASILLIDRGDFNPELLGTAPLGGAETAFIELALALSARGHRVSVRTGVHGVVGLGGIDWSPLGRPVGRAIDLIIASRDPRLLAMAPRAERRVLWVHNTAQYLLRWRHLAPLARWRPAIVFSGAYHRSTYPRWAPSGERPIVPYGVSNVFLSAPPAGRVPGPRAVFTSNPMRSLSWLVDVWSRRIQPAVPGAQLHVFAGPQVYGRWGARVADLMEPHLQAARDAASSGVVLREPVSHQALARELASARVHLYRGDPAETFCLAVAEAQAMGVPSVVQPFGSVVERIVDEETGFVARDDAEFADRAIALLRDDGLWSRQHASALSRQRAWTWDRTAAAFETLFLAPARERARRKIA